LPIYLLDAVPHALLGNDCMTATTSVYPLNISEIRRFVSVRQSKAMH